MSEERQRPTAGSSAKAAEVHPELIERIAAYMESVNLGAYVDLYRRPWRMLWLNFAAGTARGVGMAVGFAILGALLIYILSSSFLDNLPVVGRVIAELVRIVEHELQMGSVRR